MLYRGFQSSSPEASKYSSTNCLRLDNRYRPHMPLVSAVRWVNQLNARSFIRPCTGLQFNSTQPREACQFNEKIVHEATRQIDVDVAHSVVQSRLVVIYSNVDPIDFQKASSPSYVPARILKSYQTECVRSRTGAHPIWAGPLVVSPRLVRHLPRVPYLVFVRQNPRIEPPTNGFELLCRYGRKKGRYSYRLLRQSFFLP
jgi:hypothetical protein